MDRKNVLHILNGQCMYDAFMEEKHIQDGVMVPFNEAMCVGEVTQDVFSQAFNTKRCQAHSVTPEDYKHITLEPLQVFLDGQYNEVVLWFDEDMFCQINLLTALAYLDQIGFEGKKMLNLVGDKFKVLKTIPIPEQNYSQVFKEVLSDKCYRTTVELEVMAQGIQDYLALQDENNEIMQYIRANKHKTRDELLEGAMATFSRYGLGDLQYLAMIDQVIEETV